jgi:nitrite reductase/ring-hydroxylating ferredoxin subunit
MKYPAGPVDDFPAGSIEVITIRARSVGIVNTGTDFYAILNVCPHALAPVCEGRLTGTFLPSPQGAPVWGLDGRILRCPWHGFEFDLGDGGRSVFTTFRARVRMFPASVENGVVHVEMKEPRRRDLPERRT